MGIVLGAGNGYTWGWYNLSGYGKGGDKIKAYSVWLYFSGKSGPAPLHTGCHLRIALPGVSYSSKYVCRPVTSGNEVPVKGAKGRLCLVFRVKPRTKMPFISV